MSRQDTMPGGSSWRKDANGKSSTAPHHRRDPGPSSGSSLRKEGGSSAIRDSYAAPGGGASRRDGYAAGSSRRDGYAGGSSGSWRKRSSPSSSQEDTTEEGGRSNRSGFERSQDHRRAYSPVAETLFRKDLISLMKLPDNEPLGPEDFWTVQDTWKQEWEKGVQVPVKPDGLPEPQVSMVELSTKRERFTLPKKLICMNASGSYTAETHQVTPMVLRAEQVCGYDLDDVDQRWLTNLNGERAIMGQSSITEKEMERVVEELERQCREKINSSLRSSEDTEIQQDDSIICDVCRSPDSEETNEMVFCDQCNICVHQACYGIMAIPEGNWLCKTCSLGIKPPCQLCPNKGGAMKSTRSGQKWAHVSCALWIPEVSIGCVEKMEPITKISNIPQSRWSLICVLCKEKTGSCIQCSVKTCKTAYHVTCAFRHNLEMRAIIDDENSEDGVKLRSYCQKHSLNSKKTDDSDSESGGRKPSLSPEERRKKIEKFEREFFRLVDVSVACSKVEISPDVVEFIYKYWILKRRAGGNKALLVPRGEEESLSSVKGEDTERDKMKLLVGIRQDLERVRNLAYMVSRREKLSRSLIKLREQILGRQLALVADEDPNNQMSLMEMSAVIEANHGPTIYDKTFSHPDSEQHTYEDFEVIISRISGEISEGSAQIRRDNPMRTKSTESSASGGGKPEFKYERIFSDTSQSESDDSFIQNVKPVLSRRSSLSKKPRKEGKKKSPSDKKSKKAALHSKNVSRGESSSSDDEVKLQTISPRKDKNRGTSSKNAYSDSDTEDESSAVKKRGRSSKTKKESKTESGPDWRDSEDTQNSMDRPRSPVFRTKAAMKEFSLPEPSKSSKQNPPISSSLATKSAKTSLDASLSDSEKMNVDSSLILVPERSAARKANRKLNKKEEEEKKKGRAVKTSDLFGDSDSDQLEHFPPTNGSPTKSRDVRKSPRVKHGAINFVNSDHSENDSSSKSFARKDSLKLGLDKKHKMSKSSLVTPSILSDSDDDFFAAPPEKELKPSKSTRAKLNASSAGESEFDSLFDNNDIRATRSSGPDTDSEEYLNKKREFDDFENPEMFSFVPQRQAAKKASAQLREQDMWKKTQQEAYLASLAQAQLDKVDSFKKKSRPNLKKKAKSDSDQELFTRRTRSSDSSLSSDSDVPSDHGKSRGKSPKGKKAKANQSPRPAKPIVKRQRNKKSPRNSRPEGTILSSKALEYLTQRESQISNILGTLPKDGKEEIDNTGKDPPDKKLKTSEGRPDGSKSPPRSSKNSSDSESDTDTDDSIIQKFKPIGQSDSAGDSKKEQLGQLAAVVEPKGPEDRLPGGRRRNNSDLSADRKSEGDIKVKSGDELCSESGSQSTASQGQQLKQSQEKSIFSPDRSPRFSSELGFTGQTTNEGKSSSGPGAAKDRESAIFKEHEITSQSSSPRDRKIAESRSPRVEGSTRERGREILTQAKTPTKSPSLNRSSDGIKNVPHLLQSPPFSSGKEALNKSSDDLSKKEALRKFSVDSDADSAKSSLPDGDNLLQDIGKDDSTDTLEMTDKLSEASTKTDPSKAVNHAKTDEGYVSAEKPVAVQPSAVFENNGNDVTKKKEIVQNIESFVNNNEKPVSPPKGIYGMGGKVQDSAQHNLNTISTFNPESNIPPVEKPKDDMSCFFQNHSTTAPPHKAPTSHPPPQSAADLQQQLMFQDSRNWTTTTTTAPFNQADQHKPKHGGDLQKSHDSFKPDKKNADAALAQQQQQMYNEVLLNQMFSKHMTQAQSMAYAQQYMKELAGLGQNLDLLQYSQQYPSLQYQQYFQSIQIQAQQAAKKAQDEALLTQAWQDQMVASGWYNNQNISKISDLEKLSRSSLSEIEKMTREQQQQQQGKDKNKQQQHLSQQAVHKAAQESSRLDQQQRSYIDQIRSHQDQRTFQEQMRNQEKRSQSDSSSRFDDPAARYAHPGAGQAAFHHDQARAEPANSRSQLDAFVQYSQVKPDKAKAGRPAAQDPFSADLRQRAHQEQKHQQEPKKLADQFKALAEHNQIVSHPRPYGSYEDHSQYQVGGKTEHLSKEMEESSIHRQSALKISPAKPRHSADQFKPLSTSPQHKQRSSPKHEKSNFSSCRLEEQQQHKGPLDQVYGIPSATPADKLPGFVPSVAHSKEQKRQSLEGGDSQKKDRDTPASVAGSEGSQTSSAPTGIPNELLDSVLETAKLPVWKPPDKSDIKIPSPAKPAQASPPKPEPVISERDTSALEELVKHIDASPSHKEHRLDKSASAFTTPLQPCKSSQDNLEAKSNPLVYSNISGHLGSSVTQSDKDTSDADRSDYDFDSHDKGGVDYDDEEDLPPPPGRKDVADPSSTPKGTLDISTWKSDDKGSPRTKEFEKVTSAPKGGVKAKASTVYNRVNEPKPKTAVPEVTETLTKRGTKVPCYKEKDIDLEGSPSRSVPVKKAAPANLKGKAKGKGGSRMFGRKSGPKYDQKAFEKVHKNLAGTDFDFEDEFDDDVGFDPKEDVPGSLRDFRQQTKSKKVDSFDFEDSENSGVAQMPPVLLEADDEDTALSARSQAQTKKLNKTKTGKKVDSSPPPIVPKIIPLKIKKMEEKPKIPKIKIKIGNRTDSPDDKSGAKRKRRESSSQLADEPEAKNPPLKLKIPTLKIKLPPKPTDEKPEKLEESELKTVFEKKASPAVILRTTPKASPSNGKLTPAQPPKDILDDPDIFDLMPPKQDFSLESLKSDFVKSSPRALMKIKSPAPSAEQPPTSDSNTTSTSDASPKKVKGTIDSLANKLLAKQQSNSLTADKANELAAIFGPEEPLSVNLQPVSESSVAVAADKADDGPSELDLLALELKKLENDNKEMEAINVITPEKLQEESAPDRYEEDPQNRLMSMKYKLKPTQDAPPRNTTSPGPNTPVKISLMSSADPGQRRMRKKELLNSYFGIETPVQQQQPHLPAAAVSMTNGPPAVVEAAPLPAHPPPKPILPILPVRMNIIKIPKAVASVTSVPTRADYQPQLEANMERKRKREGKEDPKVKGQKKGKGKQNKSEEEPYRPKLKKTQDVASEQSEAKERRTRGMPPKKCFEESPEREGPLDSFKKSYMRYGEEMFKKFEEEPKAPTEKERRKRDKKRRRDDDEKEPVNSKTPRIVIKFSKTKEQQPKDSSGLKPVLSQDSGNNIPKLKIKPPVK